MGYVAAGHAGQASQCVLGTISLVQASPTHGRLRTRMPAHVHVAMSQKGDDLSYLRPGDINGLSTRRSVRNYPSTSMVYTEASNAWHTVHHRYQVQRDGAFPGPVCNQGHWPDGRTRRVDAATTMHRAFSTQTF